MDELLFAQDRHPQLNASDLEMAKFFLTARSNSPEVNLFNQPRMAIWPINAGTKKPSTLDKLIAFCATINKQPYYFQRQSPSSSTADMTSFNGRNRDLWNYINQELAQPIPGFGHTTFADKYTAPETKQITTEIFDYIRSTNLYSTALGADAYTGDVNPSSTSGSLTPPRKPGTRVGQTTPLKIDDTKGFGRIPTISRAIFQLFISGARRVDASGNPIAGAQWTPTAIGRTPYLDPTDASNAVYTGWQNFLNTVKAGEKVQLLTSGILYFDTFDPNVGYTAPRYNFLVNVTSSGAWQVNRQSLNFPANATVKVNLDQNYLYNSKTNQTLNLFLSRFLGGPLGPQWMMQNYSFLQGNPVNAFSHKITYDVGTIDYGQLLQTSPKNTGYPLVSARIPIHVPITLIGSTPKNLPNNSVIPAAERTPNIQFSGGSLTVQLEAGGAGGNTGEVVQTYHFDFPPFQKPAPIYADNETRSPRSATMVFPTAKQFPVSADFRFRWNNAPWWHAFYSPGAYVSNPQDDDDRQYDYVDLRLVQDGDVAVSLVPVNGDKRLLAAKSDLDTATDFQPHQDYTNPAVRAAVDFRTDNLGAHSNYKLTPGSGNGRPGRILNLSYGANGMPDIPGHMPNGVQTALGLPFVPDFDNAPFYVPDDAYINRADAGSVTDQLGTATGVNASGGSGGREVAWYVDRPDQSAWASGKDNENFCSPARQMPSAVMFGSLPTGVKRNKPWQTLLFRPDPGKHPGASNPPDYALLDLFWMPVVEPYAISEPFSSNGKVNMNYQIAPFTYITRANALHGVMLSEEMLAVPDSQVNAGSGPSAYNPNIFSDGVEATGAASYKAYSADLTNLFSTYQFRKKINVTETLKGFQQRFDAGQIFRSETEICSLSLIPEGETWKANFESWWDNYRLTGDNSREQPYAHLLPRLTTKSNTYTVHFRVQSLKKHPVTSDAEAALWDEARDAVTSEYRGSRTVERYIDPNDERIPNYARPRGRLRRSRSSIAGAPWPIANFPPNSTELGRLLEANEELEQSDADQRSHSEVLALRVKIYRAL
ncbi:MAG: Verru_Chthon cassette protein A [Chthoniobacter sp.]